MIQYGLISRVDADCLEATLNFICNDFPEGVINTCEIGIYAGITGQGISSHIRKKGRNNFHTGIDNKRDNETIRAYPDRLIVGNSNEVYNLLENDSQHLVLIDGNHSFPFVVSDYYCYKTKIKTGGYLCFHDTSPQAQGKDWQLVGDRNDSDMGISVLKALAEIGLLDDTLRKLLGWKLVFNEWDENDRCGGVVILKKIPR